MAKEELKDKVLAVAALLGFAVLGIAFWQLVAKFMWMCHAAGIPM